MMSLINFRKKWGGACAIVIATLTLPITVIAAAPYNQSGSGLFARFIGNVKDALMRSIDILFILATIVFIWGLIRYLSPDDSTEKISEGRIYIVYGIITLFFMYSVWSIAIMISKSFFGNY